MKAPSDPDPSVDPPPEAPLVAAEPGEIVLRAESVDAESAIDYETPVERTGWRSSILAWIVLGSIGGLFFVAVILPRVSTRGRTVNSRLKTEIAYLETALDAFEIDNGRYPTTAEGLQALITPPANTRAWNGPYIKSVPTDPWGTPYVYQFPGKHNPANFDLSSYGPDRNPGRDDIHNWSGP
jgi:general secretion pathway protein G